MAKSSHAVNNVKDLSPDGYSRFYVIADCLQQIYGPHKKPLRILDVGGGSQFLGQQLEIVHLDYDLTILDIIPKPKEVTANYLQDDATNMQLENNSYDVVVSTDTLEHIPNSKKHTFVEECIRVAKEVFILAAPFETEGVNNAEVIVNNFNKKLFGSGQDWLEEHFLCGKPEISNTIAILEKHKLNYDSFGTQNLTTWMLNTHINLIEAKLGLDSKKHIDTNRFYNENILEMGDFEQPTYRHFFVIYKDESKRKQLNIKKFINSKRNVEKTNQYTHELMEVIADRIDQMNKFNEKSALDIESLTTTRDQLLQRIHQLESKIENQQRILKRLGPIVAVGRSKPVRAAYRYIKRKNNG